MLHGPYMEPVSLRHRPTVQFVCAYPPYLRSSTARLMASSRPDATPERVNLRGLHVGLNAEGGQCLVACPGYSRHYH